jgi:hypothetical protein
MAEEATEATEETPEEAAARKMMEDSFSKIVQSSLDQFVPGMSAYDQMLADQGYGIYGSPVAYNLPGDARGTRYSLMSGQPYANYNTITDSSRWTGGGGDPSFDYDSPFPVIKDPDVGAEDSWNPIPIVNPNYNFPDVDRFYATGPNRPITGPISLGGIGGIRDLGSIGNIGGIKNYLDEDYEGSPTSSRRLSLDKLGKGKFGQGIKNLFDPDKTIRGRELQYGDDYNVRDRVFKNPEFENLLGNVLSATSGLGMIPGFGDALSKVTGGGIGLLLKGLEYVPGLGKYVKIANEKLDQRAKDLSGWAGQGSTSLMDVTRNLVPQIADKVWEDRPGYFLPSVDPKTGKTSGGIKRLPSRIADKIWEDRPNYLLKGYDEDTGRLEKGGGLFNIPRRALSGIRDKIRESRGYHGPDGGRREIVSPPITLDADPSMIDAKEDIQNLLASLNQSQSAPIDFNAMSEAEQMSLIDPFAGKGSRGPGMDMDTYGFGQNIQTPDAAGIAAGVGSEIMENLPFETITDPTGRYYQMIDRETGEVILTGEHHPDARGKSDWRRSPGGGMASGGLMYLADGDMLDKYPRKNGQISGPGTERSDDIPAMLSDGEFVTNAAALRGIGQMAGAPANDKAEQRRLGAREMYKLQRQGMKAAGVV